MKEPERSAAQTEKLFTGQTSPGPSTVLMTDEKLCNIKVYLKAMSQMRPNPEGCKVRHLAETQQPEPNIFTVKHGGGSIVFYVTFGCFSD